MSQQEQQQQQQFGIACKSCRRLHKKCDKLLPSCTTCKEKGIPCVYVPPKKRKRREKQVTSEDEATWDSVETIEYKIPLSQQLISQFDHLCTCLFERDSLEYKIEKFGWVASEALSIRLFACGPASYVEKWKLRRSEYPRLDIGALRQQHDKQELMNVAEEMYNTVREFLISPQIFQHLASNPRVVKTALLVVAYSLHTQKNVAESKLIMGSLDVFFANRPVQTPGTDLSLFVYRFHKFLLASTTLPYTMESLHKIFAEVQQLFEAVVGGNIASSQNKKLEYLLHTEQGLPLVFKFMALCNEIINGENPVKTPIHDDVESDLSFRKLAMFHLQFYVLQIELNKTQDEHAYSILYALRLKISQQMIGEVSNNAIIATSLISKFIYDACRVHIDHSNTLLGNPSANMDEVDKTLQMLTLDLYVFENIAQMSDSQEYDLLLTDLRTQIGALKYRKEVLNVESSKVQEQLDSELLSSLLNEDTFDLEWSDYFSNSNTYL